MDDDLDAVIRHYDDGHEEHRLTDGFSQLELVRTQEVLRRHLPPAPARVLDVGGATGIHADWLLGDGYEVHLIDLSPRHVETALANLGSRGLTAEVGDARQLGHDDDSFDAVLVLGPLYHLQDRDDRIAAISEARRVARTGAVVAVAAISRFASLFDGLAREFIFDAEFRRIVESDLADGRHSNPEDRPHWFTTAFFHRPDELADELATAGLSRIEVFGVEGLAGWLAHLESRWADPDDRNVILDFTRRVEAEPALLGLSAHLLALARAD